jgi:hypothetical protein
MYKKSSNIVYLFLTKVKLDNNTNLALKNFKKYFSEYTKFKKRVMSFLLNIVFFLNYNMHNNHEYIENILE